MYSEYSIHVKLKGSYINIDMAVDGKISIDKAFVKDDQIELALKTLNKLVRISKNKNSF